MAGFEQRRSRPIFLCVDGDDGNVAMVSQLCRTGCLEDIGKEGMLPGEGQDQVDVVVGNELIGGLHKIEQPDEIEIGLVILQ